MAIMPQIAMGFQMPQIQLPNQGNMLMQIAQLQQMQEANALRQAQARKLQLDEERGNALAIALQGGQPTLERLVAADPGRGFEVYKAFQEQQKAQREEAERQQEQMRKRQGTLAQTLFNLRDDPSVDNLARAWQTLNQGGMGEGLESTVAEMLLMTPEQRRAAANQYIKTTPGMAEYIMGRSKEEEDIRKKAMETEKLIAERDVERARLKGTLPTQPQQSELARLLAERNALPQRHPDRAAYDQRIARLGQAPTTTVEVNTGENIEEGARRRSLVEEENRARVAAQAARKTLVSVDSAERVLDSGFNTGFGTEVKATAAGLLGALGVKDAEKFATNAQTFLKAAMDQVLARQIEQKGVQTNQDAQRMEQTFAQLGNTPAANRFVLAVFRAQSNMALEQDQFYRKWVKDKGTMKGAEDAWLEQQGNKSIFERPELKQYAPKKDAPTPLPDVINFKDLRSR
jgi:hypothetical protein